MSLNYLSICLIIIFPVSEIINGIIKRAKTVNRKKDPISEVILWIVIVISVTSAVLIRQTEPFNYNLAEPSKYSLVTGLMLFGMLVRWAAITTLGKYFTFNITVQPDQHLIQNGIYKYIRHPSYAGLILIFCGMGFYFSNWLSLMVLVIPITGVLLFRIYIEERVLHEAFGRVYEEYCAKTKRLIPKVI